MNNLENLIRNYLPNIIHLSLATCAGNKPWVCEVHFVYDDELNLYFISLPTRRHSEEIAKNPNVAGNIVVQHGLGEKPQGIYFEGQAEMLEADENSAVYKEYIKRFSDREEFCKAELAKEDGHRFYKITVSDFYVFDVRGNLTPPGKHHLAWKNI
jgi:uncharacterized protein YhbP (UPF0306 family)